MEKIAAVVVVALLLVVLPCSRATNYNVGGSGGWTTGQTYTTWTSGKTFLVGDALVFTYGSTHDVVQVPQTSYDSCSITNAIATSTSSPTTITLSNTGAWYFICGTPGHCGQGMKLMVNVTSSSTSPPTSPSPPGTTSPPPPSTSTNGSTTSPPPPPPSGSGASVLSVGMMAVAWAAVVLFLA